LSLYFISVAAELVDFADMEKARMDIPTKALWLFGLNFLDAVFTLFWVKNNLAEEGNTLMAHLLHLGDAPFLAVKILIGTLALLVFCRYSHLRLANVGLSLALGVYSLLMVIHLLTGISALSL
jgi:hypothetical protein